MLTLFGMHYNSSFPSVVFGEIEEKSFFIKYYNDAIPYIITVLAFSGFLFFILNFAKQLYHSQAKQKDLSGNSFLILCFIFLNYFYYSTYIIHYRINFPSTPLMIFFLLFLFSTIPDNKFIYRNISTRTIKNLFFVLLILINIYTLSFSKHGIGMWQNAHDKKKQNSFDQNMSTAIENICQNEERIAVPVKLKKFLYDCNTYKMYNRPDFTDTKLRKSIVPFDKFAFTFSEIGRAHV